MEGSGLLCAYWDIFTLSYAVAGLATAVVSNFDTRLRPLLGLLGLEPLFDAIVVRRAHA